MSEPRSVWIVRYNQRKAQGRCTTCGGMLLPEWGGYVNCPACLERRGLYRMTKRGRRVERSYRRKVKVRKATAAASRVRRLQRKLAGVCRDCTSPALDDSNYCEPHRELHRRSCRDYMRRRAEAQRNGTPIERKQLGRARDVIVLTKRDLRARDRLELPRPPSVDPVHDYRMGELTMAAAALRFVELHNGVTASDIGDAFGATMLERDAITQALHRAKVRGAIRVEAGWSRALGVYYPLRAQRRAA